jgi:hypothetical protein
MKNLPVEKVIPPEYQCKSVSCKIFSHWLNPFGNWNEPLPFPEKRKLEAQQSWLPPFIYWNLRNPFHNFCHYWIGITPLGKRYEWIIPESNDWIRTTNNIVGNRQYSYWSKGLIKLPFFNYDNGKFQFYIGWLSRGNFGLAFRKIA